MNTEALSLSCSLLGAVGQGREGASNDLRLLTLAGLYWLLGCKT